MKSQWNELCESLAGYGDMVLKTLEFLPSTKQCNKIKKQLSSHWKRITENVGLLDSFIDPVDPFEIQYPFESERFKAMWKYYRDYLIESHNMILCSRVENSRLMQLCRFSGKDEERAMLILELLCANNYKNIICPSEKQISGEEPIDQEHQPALSVNLIPQEI